MSKKMAKKANARDWDGDGLITEYDIAREQDMQELELQEEKADTQKRMAWFSLVLMAVVTILLFTPLISDTKTQTLSDLLGMFYVAQAGIVGAYMGVTAWMTNQARSSASSNAAQARAEMYSVRKNNAIPNDEER
jgi:hypothetical protein